VAEFPGNSDRSRHGLAGLRSGICSLPEDGKVATAFWRTKESQGEGSWQNATPTKMDETAKTAGRTNLTSASS
jgi:hypothetical protein